MIICKHKDGGWYGAHGLGKFKDPRSGEWIPVVQYQRLAIDLKTHEEIDVLYCRTRLNFQENFQPYTLDAFEREVGARVTGQEFFQMKPIKKIKYEDVYDESDLVTEPSKGIGL
jgi:hypothetical protein